MIFGRGRKIGRGPPRLRHGPGLKNDDDAAGNGNPHGGAGGEARGERGEEGEARGEAGEARGDGGAGAYAGGGEGDRDAGGGGVGDATQTSSVIIPETTDERVFFLALGLSGFAMMLTGIVFMTHSWYLTHSSAAILARPRPK